MVVKAVMAAPNAGDVLRGNPVIMVEKTSLNPTLGIQVGLIVMMIGSRVRLICLAAFMNGTNH